jgi:N-methylhydantoinase B
METTEPALGNTAGDGVRYPAYGVLGGKDGLPHRYRMLSRGRTRVLKTKEVGIPIPPGAVFLVESMGGGGYGPPARRPAEARAADRVNGFVSGSSSGAPTWRPPIQKGAKPPHGGRRLRRPQIKSARSSASRGRP